MLQGEPVKLGPWIRSVDIECLPSLGVIRDQAFGELDAGVKLLG
jgi:hypothetical protein